MYLRETEKVFEIVGEIECDYENSILGVLESE